MIDFSEAADLQIGDGVVLIFAQLSLLLTVLWIIAGLLGVKHMAVPQEQGAPRNMRGTGGKWSEDTYAVQPPVPFVPAGTSLL